MEKKLARIALFAALIAALGFIPPITLGFGVPISAQSLGVMLAGAVLGSKHGGLAVLLFLFAVALGLPLLSGGRGGIGVFGGPTVGFLVGFPIGAYVTGLVVERIRSLPPAITAGLGAVLGGVVVMYMFGAAGMVLVLKISFTEAAVAVTPFIPGDLLKAALTGMLIAAVAKLRPDMLAWHNPVSAPKRY